MMQDFDKKILNDYKQVVVYGGGDDGKTILRELKAQGITNIVVCDKQDNHLDCDDYKVIAPDRITEQKDSCFIIGTGKYCCEVYDNLINKGVNKKDIFKGTTLYENAKEKNGTDLEIIPMYYSYRGNLKKLDAKINKGWHLQKLGVNVTEICTLRCKYCVSFATKYKDPKNYSANFVSEGLDNLLSSNCYISQICFTGGEPFINQATIVELLKRYGKHPQIGCFVSISNGTIVPSDDTLRVMKEFGNYYVIFSNYGNLSRNQDKAVNKLKEYGIPVAVEQPKDIKESSGTKWRYYGDLKHFDYPKEKHRKMFKECLDAAECTTLLNNKFYLCTRSAHMDNLGGIIKPETKNVFFDLSNSNVKDKSPKEIEHGCKSILVHEQYAPVCEYCDRDQGIWVERALQES